MESNYPSSWSFKTCHQVSKGSMGYDKMWYLIFQEYGVCWCGQKVLKSQAGFYLFDADDNWACTAEVSASVDTNDRTTKRGVHFCWQHDKMWCPFLLTAWQNVVSASADSITKCGVRFCWQHDKMCGWQQSSYTPNSTAARTVVQTTAWDSHNTMKKMTEEGLEKMASSIL